MNILVLNGSPRLNGNTKKMIEAFRKGAESVGHAVHIIDVCITVSANLYAISLAARQ